MTGALKEYPDDVTLLFNKGLCHLQLKEFKEAIAIYQHLLNKLGYKNAVLMNLIISKLRLELYE